ncbi:hypothetical protein [Rhizobium alvei]|uniref:Uncharacterized protein n=1 Tax=Rhizobium alvei TaxID=1132659 RepID=A0ABT8YGI3_9HYPH|nr:hypothetical protein [Rhizobium alvei]MDO6962756.1 hypothetical protein [Rhizobium alvei]
MAQVHITNSSSTVTANTANTDYLLDDGVIVNVGGSNAGIFAAASVTGRTFSIAGDVVSAGTGMIVGDYSTGGGAADSFTISKTGSITGSAGLVLYGDGQKATNSGTIEGTTLSGLYLGGDESRFVNRGDISGAQYGVNIMGENTTFINRGTISGGTNNAGIYLGSDSGTVINYGTITGNEAVDMSAAKSGVTFKNFGEISYGAILSDADDIFVNRGGTVSATVYGGDGNDDYYVDSATEVAIDEFANEGRDSVYSSASWTLRANFEELYLTGNANINGEGNGDANVLFGNGGNNKLNGGGQADALWGGAGNDILRGGIGADGFYFKSNGDKEIVRDFKDGVDGLILAVDTELTNLQFVKQHGVNVGDDLVITYDGTTMIIENVHKNQITDADFFV